MANMPELPHKRFATTIWLRPPAYCVFVDSWEEAMEIGQELLESCITERDRGTTAIVIDPLKPTRQFYEEKHSKRAVGDAVIATDQGI